MTFARDLADELRSIGMSDVTLDENGYIMATLESNQPADIRDKVPVVGFIAHMDTSPDASGENVKATIVKAEERDYIDRRYAGQDVIVTDETTLLGADDKAGIAEIVSAMEHLIQHPEIRHGKIRVGFTPDEEIGQGADYFDVKAFGADYAYTMDGGTIGELEFENFNAAACKIKVHGLNVHPGAAYHKMRNSMRIANQIISMIPSAETPEHTKDYQGFFHLTSIEGTVEETTLSYIIRDHDSERFKARKLAITQMVEAMNLKYGEGTAEIDLRDQYYNMREKIEPVIQIVNLAQKAMKEVEVVPHIKPIRGGTDGARLSFEGLPCPNIFAGGENFHSRYEYLPIPSLEKAKEVILHIVMSARFYVINKE
jgi:tripeptide aminopeptidase